MNGVACALVALLVGGGAGSRHLETTIQDDASLLYRPPAAVARSIAQIAAIGADRVRLTAGWSALTLGTRDTSKPGPPFEPRDSRTYPHDGFTRLDTAVRAAHAAGLQVQIDVGFWAPRWAVAAPGPQADRQRVAPSPRELGHFAEAVARRYDGHFEDPERAGRTLPAVRLYTTWNEPNNPDFLEPQWTRDGAGGWRPESAHIYRAMHTATYDAIKGVDPDNLVLIGGTAATGSDEGGQGGIRPLRFLRTLACVDDRLAPLAVPECRGFAPLRADGYAHHPYSLLTPPTTSDPHADDVRIADGARLTALLHELRSRGRLAQDLEVYDTEFGYESRPPDPYARFDPREQAQFQGAASFLAWATPGTRMLGQFLLRDLEPGGSGGRPGSRQYWSELQSGLLFADGRPKPAAAAYKLPFYAQTASMGGRRVVLLFGQVRGAGPWQTVRVQRRDPHTGGWVAVRTAGATCGENRADFLTDDGGTFLRTARFEGAGSYRLTWLDPNGGQMTGIEAPVGERPSSLPALPEQPPR
jgi:hypothetical protein